MKMRWFKLWAEGHLHGSTRQLQPDERSVWIDFLALAAQSETPSVIQVAPGVPWTDVQLARLLVVSKQLLRRAKKRLAETDKISVDERGLIHVVNWTRYQGEYARLKNWRSRSKDVSNETANETQDETANVHPADLDQDQDDLSPPPHPPPSRSSAHKARLKTGRKGWAAQSRQGEPTCSP